MLFFLGIAFYFNQWIFPSSLLLSHFLPVRHSLLHLGWDQITECNHLQDRMAACCLISLQGIEWQGMKPSEKGLHNLKPVAWGYRECSKAVVYLKIYQISQCKCQIQCIYLKDSFLIMKLLIIHIVLKRNKMLDVCQFLPSLPFLIKFLRSLFQIQMQGLLPLF